MPEFIDTMIETWLNTPFEGGRYEARVAKIAQLENEFSSKDAAD